MKVLEVIKQHKTDKHVMSLMGYEGEVKYLHVDNFITKEDSMFIPFEDLEVLLAKYTKED